MNILLDEKAINEIDDITGGDYLTLNKAIAHAQARAILTDLKDLNKFHGFKPLERYITQLEAELEEGKNG